MMNTFGNLFRLTSFGESHGAGIGGVIDGCPAGIELDMTFIQNELNRRRPGQSKITTPRKEADEVTFLSGVFEGKTTGTPIGFIIWNDNQHSADYDNMKEVFRPSHADYTYQTKYGIRDHRGGGRSSARETIARCVAGAIAKLVLMQEGVHIQAFTSQVGSLKLDKSYQAYDLSLTESNAVRCPDPQKAAEMEDLIAEVKSQGDTIGGVVETVVGGVPVGLGSYVQWDTKLDAKIAQAVVSINAFKGVEFGLGFKDGYLRGSQVMDEILWNEEDGYTRRTNNLGGFEGGMTNGQPIVVRGVMKPIPTLYKPLMSVDIETHEPYKATVERSDPTALPAAGVVMESVVATVVANEILDKFSSDNLEELKEAVAHHRDYVKNF